MALLDSDIKRRDFLKGGVAAAMAVAAGGVAGCKPNDSQEELSETGSEGLAPHVIASDVAILEDQGKWITACCPYNCGGQRCVNQVYVVDGVVLRQRSVNDVEDSEELPQIRPCPRGRAQRMNATGLDRIKYPMKRKHWQPGGGDNVNGELRGVDTWERISWDDALDMIASEVKRVYDTYGPRSVFCPAPFAPAAINLMGGSLVLDETKSYGSWMFGTFDMGLNILYGNHANYSANDRVDMQNADTIVLYGVDTVWSSAGNGAYYFRLAKEKGTDFIFVGPNYPQTASLVEAKWIQVRPGTDTALLLAVIYEMLRLDQEQGNVIDWDFVHKYTVGFDAESMPADAKLDENLKDYVLGVYDDQPKTPEWATEICGTPVEDITWYAERLGKQYNVMSFHNYAPARYNGAEHFPQLFLASGFLGGHAGRPGNATGCSYAEEGGNSGDRLVLYGAEYPEVQSALNPLENPQISGPEVWSRLVEGTYTNRGYGGMLVPMRNAFAPEKEYTCDVKLIYGIENDQSTSTTDLPHRIQAYRKCEFAVTTSYAFTFASSLNDIILPITMGWEGNLDSSAGEVTLSHYFPGVTAHCHGRDHAVFPSPVIPPIYEAKSKNWISIEIMKRLGVEWEPYYLADDAQRYFNCLAGAQVAINDTHDYHPLVTITQEDIDAWGVTGTPQEGVIGLSELLEKGYYQVPRKKGDSMGFIGYKEFVDDPDNNPLGSVSGKIELYCQARADNINCMGYTSSETKPYPTYRRSRQSYEDTFVDWENKVKGEYPFQLFQPHYLRRSHTNLDNIQVLQEAFLNPVFLNADDAAEKGIQNGDTVIVYNTQGKVLRHASLTNTLMRGVVALPHGPRPDVDFETGIDRGGNEETLVGLLQMGEWVPQLNAYNSCLVNYEKYDGEAIPRDCDRDLFIIKED